MNNLYQQRLLEHYRNSPFKKQLASADIVTQMYNPSCGDRVSFQIRVVDGAVADIAFDGSGCVLSIAAASLLAESMCGTQVSDVHVLGVDDMRRLVAMPVGPVRLTCILLALEAVQNGCMEYIKKKE